MTQPINATGMDQADYLKIFMQELNYQDPLKPVDNKEFMAQMAQFSALQQAGETNDNLKSLLQMTSANQALSLLNRSVKTATASGNVKNIQISQDGVKLEIYNKTSGERFYASMNDITEVMGSIGSF